MHGKLIVFSGLDGAGKSTQIDLLGDRLTKAKIRYVTYWSRGGYTPGMETAKSILRRLTGQRLIPAAGDSADRTQQLRSPWKRRLWLRLAILDLWAFYAVWFRIQMLTGRLVVADRYWQDTLLDFRLNFASDHVDSWLLWKWLTKTVPRPTCAFLITVPIDVSERRSAEKREPFPTPIEQLRARAAQYQTWRQSGQRWHWVDGTLEKNSIAEDIWSQTTSSLRGNSKREIRSIVEKDRKTV